MLKKVLVGFVIMASFAGCLKGENNTTCSYDECAVKAPASEIQAVQEYLTANNITNAQQHCSGFFYNSSFMLKTKHWQDNKLGLHLITS